MPPEPSYYDQFLKTTPGDIKPITSDANTTWYELVPTDDLNFTTTMLPEEELWESISPVQNGSHIGKLNDVEILFDNENGKKVLLIFFSVGLWYADSSLAPYSIVILSKDYHHSFVLAYQISVFR